MNFTLKGRGARRASDENARLRRQVRDLEALDIRNQRQIRALVAECEDERELRRAAEQRTLLAEDAIALKGEQLARERDKFAHVWEQVKTRPPTPYPAKVTVINAGIPVVLPVKPVKPRMDLPPWAPRAGSVAETTQPIPLAQRERHQTSWGAANQNSKTTHELPLPQPQQAAS